MNDIRFKITALCVTGLAVMWSLWAFINFPIYWNANIQYDMCNKQAEDSGKANSAYCAGFDDGYEWAWNQIKMDYNLGLITTEELAKALSETNTTPKDFK